MTLAFSTHWPSTMPPHMAGQRTNFVEQIRLGLTESKIVTVAENHEYFPFNEEIYRIEMSMQDTAMKLHTIREDKSNRWKTGNKIHMVINNRTPERFQFAPVVKCVSTQKIQVCHYSELMYGKTKPIVQIDNVRLNDKEVETLALNDGFASVEDFFSWFNKDFTGKIIHWTNLKY